ncbi:MAG: Integrator complex subunit 6, partial [Paramarteilia canceri]
MLRWDIKLHLIEFGLSSKDHPKFLEIDSTNEIITDSKNAINSYRNFSNEGSSLGIPPPSSIDITSKLSLFSRYIDALSETSMKAGANVQEAVRTAESLISTISFSGQQTVKLNLKRIITNYDEEILLKGLNNNQWQDCFVDLVIQPGKSSLNHWPILEWLSSESMFNSGSDSIKTHSLYRSSIPTIGFVCKKIDALAIDNFPYDKYEVVSKTLNQIFEKNVPSNKCWQLFLPANAFQRSTNPEYDKLVKYPFGYLKSGANHNNVKLFLMPFNYPTLIPLMDELFCIHKSHPNAGWLSQFQAYLSTVPQFYIPFLKKVLSKLNLQNLIDENNVSNVENNNNIQADSLQQWKQVKSSTKSILYSINCDVAQIMNEVERENISPSIPIELVRKSEFKKQVSLNKGYNSKINELLEKARQFSLCSYGSEISLTSNDEKKASDFDENFNKELKITEVDRYIDSNFFNLTDKSAKDMYKNNLHHLPVSQSGNYNEYVSRAETPLRDIFPLPGRVNMFGNPFKLNKPITSVDEADEVDNIVGESNGNEDGDIILNQKNGTNKRPKGPLPKYFSLSDIKSNKDSLPDILSEPEESEPELHPKDGDQNLIKEDISISTEPRNSYADSSPPAKLSKMVNGSQSENTQSHYTIDNGQFLELKTHLKTIMVKPFGSRLLIKQFEEVLSKTLSKQKSISRRMFNDLQRECFRYKRSILAERLADFESL